MSNIRYVVTGVHETSDNEIGYFEYEDEALAKVNELMIATNDDTTKWHDGQEREFLDLCAEHPQVWGAVAIYDLYDFTDADQAALTRFFNTDEQALLARY